MSSSVWYNTTTPSNGVYLEFNRDNFLCNHITQNNDSYPQSADDSLCSNYKINSVCKPTDKYIDKKHCEVCKNFFYRDWYDSNQPSNAAYDDAREQYLRAWLQTMNLGVSIILILSGIYYQQT